MSQSTYSPRNGMSQFQQADNATDIRNARERRMILTLWLVFAILIGWFQFSTLNAEDAPNPKAAATTEPVVAAAETSGSYRLQYKYSQDETVRYESVHNVKFVSQFKGTDETATNRTETIKRYKVVATHPDGSADLELVIEWVRMKVNFGGGDLGVEFDSKDPAAKSQTKFRNVYNVIGKPQATLRCAANGKVLKRVLSKSATAASKSGDVQLKEVTEQDDFLTIFPEHAMKVGETWFEKFGVKVTVEDNLQQTIDLKRTYKLDSVDGKLATVSFKTAILTPVNNPAISVQLIQREPTGKLVFDLERGAVVTRTVDIDKTLIKPIGDNTAMQAVSHLFERLVTATAEISDVPADSAKK
jgi:hypothetical protein